MFDGSPNPINFDHGERTVCAPGIGSFWQAFELLMVFPGFDTQVILFW